MSEPSTSLASVRTVSTELYIPPAHRMDVSLKDHSVSNFNCDLPTVKRPNSSGTRAEDSIQKGRKRSENHRTRKKRRKESQSELAAGDVEAAIGMIVSAAEAVVVGLLMDSLTSSLSLDHSTILEAALSLGKSRHLSGLDKYELSTTPMDIEEEAWQDLDEASMEEAYADVGMNFDDTKHPLGVGKETVEGFGTVEVLGREWSRRCCSERCDSRRTEGDNLGVCEERPQDCESAQFIPDEVAKEDHELRVSHLETANFSLQGKMNEDEQQLLKVAMKESNELPHQIAQLAAQAVCPMSCLFDIGGKLAENTSQDRKQSCDCLAAVSFDSEVEIGEAAATDPQTSRGYCLQDMQVPESSNTAQDEGPLLCGVIEAAKHGQKSYEVPSEPLPTSFPVEKESTFNLGREFALKVLENSRQSCNTAQVFTRNPAEKFEEPVARSDIVEFVNTDVTPESDIICTNEFSTSGLKVTGFQNRAEHDAGTLHFWKEVDAEGVSGSLETAVKDNASQLVDTSALNKALKQGLRDLHVDRPSEELPVKTATTMCPSPYISRWFGGWTVQAELRPAVDVLEDGADNAQRSLALSMDDTGSEDRVPEQDAFLLKQKCTRFGKKRLSTHKIRLAVTQTVSPVQNDKFPLEKDESGGSQSKHPLSQTSTPGSYVPFADPLCSFVPCSISSPAVTSWPHCDKSSESSKLSASVNALARAAIDLIDSRKQVCHPPAGPTNQVYGVSDLGAGPSIEQTVETSRASISNAKVKDAGLRCQAPSMRKFSTTSSSLSLLLQAVNIADNVLPKEGDGHISRGPALSSPSAETVPVEVDMSADCDIETSREVTDVMVVNRKAVFKKKGRTSSDLWTCGDLMDSPPLLWPGRKKCRLKACKIVDSDSESLTADASISASALPAHENYKVSDHLTHAQEHMVTNASEGSAKRVLRRSSRNTLTKACHDPKILFKGFQFLVTGFNPLKKQKIAERIEHHGGDLLADIPAFSPKQRFKSRGVDSGARTCPIVIAPKEVRTPKYLYGCAIGSPLLHASWISASISAVRVLPYHRYQHKKTRSGCGLQNKEGGVSRSSQDPLFMGLEFHFHGQQDFVSQFSTLAKHAGGKVSCKLISRGKVGQKLVRLVVAEDSSDVPLNLRRTAAQLELHVVDAEWMVLSLLLGKLLPIPTKSTAQGCLNPNQQLIKKSNPRRVCGQLPLETHVNTEGGASGIGFRVKKLKTTVLPDESGCMLSTARANFRGRDLDQPQVETWLGRGFTSPPQVPVFAEGTMGLYSKTLPHKKLSKGFLYYDAFLYNGVEYLVGDNVEVRSAFVDCAPTFVRIEGLWCEEGRLPETRAFQQGLRKKAFRPLVLQCRRFYRPSDTGFPGRSTNELYLSNDLDYSILACDIVRRVRIALDIAGRVVHCKNWYEDQETAPNCRKEFHVAEYRASPEDYICQFFYDHAHESLHLIKLQ